MIDLKYTKTLFSPLLNISAGSGNRVHKEERKNNCKLYLNWVNTQKLVISMSLSVVSIVNKSERAIFHLIRLDK